jgi:hypothetical protein
VKRRLVCLGGSVSANGRVDRRGSREKEAGNDVAWSTPLTMWDRWRARILRHATCN